MTKVTSKTSISFPKLNWGITAGEVRELPEDKEAQERIMQEADISVVTENHINNKTSHKDTSK